METKKITFKGRVKSIPEAEYAALSLAALNLGYYDMRRVCLSAHVEVDWTTEPPTVTAEYATDTENDLDGPVSHKGEFLGWLKNIKYTKSGFAVLYDPQDKKSVIHYPYQSLTFSTKKHEKEGIHHA